MFSFSKPNKNWKIYMDSLQSEKEMCNCVRYLWVLFNTNPYFFPKNVGILLTLPCLFRLRFCMFRRDTERQTCFSILRVLGSDFEWFQRFEPWDAVKMDVQSSKCIKMLAGKFMDECLPHNCFRDLQMNCTNKKTLTTQENPLKSFTTLFRLASVPSPFFHISTKTQLVLVAHARQVKALGGPL